MEIGTMTHGFYVERVRELPELEAKLWELTHEKTGAQLCWLDRADENKAFSIAFKTLPEDSTGVFHILEHSVLCGSDKYPVKEPFVELLKSSVQTFLNAMTYPDKTVYPVSSRNDQDFLNLMDIYLDAVLHPAIYHTPEIFRQEGWRYELGEQPVYQGVVLNEMKGAFSSPATVLENAMNEMLFPDNCYRYVSGGDPEHIVDLTYEQFIANHRKYYHPSNARISLVGSVDMDAALAKIDGFLAAYDRREVRFDIPMQSPVASVEREIPYEIGPEEPEEQRTIVSCGTLLGSFADRERNYAASILADYLTGDDSAPLKRALLDAGLGQEMMVNVHDGLQQTWISWDVWNTDRDKLPAIRQTIRATLEEIAAKGLDRDRLLACYNHFAFQMRDRDGSQGYPRSLGEALELLDTWLYGGDPAEGLLVEEPLKSLAARLDTDYFASLIRELLLDDTHAVTAVLIPSRTLGQENARREAERIAAESGAWTAQRRKELEEQAESLTRWQQTEDSPEALATIPILQLSDLAEKPEPLPMTVTKRGDTTILRHRLGDKLLRLRVHFNASDLALGELPTLVVLCQLLGTMATAHYTGAELQMRIKQKIGRLSFVPAVAAGSDPDHCRLRVTASLSCLPEQAEEALALLLEILKNTVFTDRKLLRDMLQQAAMGMQMSLAANGHRFAITRVGAYGTAHGAAQEYLGGTELAGWFKTVSTADDTSLDELLAAMEHIAGKVFVARRLTLSCSEHVDEALLDRLAEALPTGEAAPAEAAYRPLGTKQEGLVIPAAVGFVGKGTNLKRHGGAFTGSIPVLAGVLNFVYLWSEIRVQGGAYGCGFNGRDDGDLFYYTFRDPQPGRSLDVLNQCTDFIRDFCADGPDLTKFILGAVSSLDPLLSAEEKMTTAESRYFKGASYEDVCRLYHQLTHTTTADLLALCDALEAITADGQICVIAGQSQIEGCGDRLTSRRSV